MKIIILFFVLLVLFTFTPGCVDQGGVQSEADVSREVTDISKDVKDIDSTLDEIDQAFG